MNKRAAGFLILMLAVPVLPALAGDAEFAKERKSLCDTGSQVRDGLLTVRTDVRDGQVKIGQEASFKVYVFNGMNRALFDVNLEVVSNEFSAEVKPAAGWKGYPTLETVMRGGGREQFDVVIKRRAGVPDGAYKIDLKLTGSRETTKNLPVTSVGLEAAADLQTLPAAEGVKVAVDGKVEEAEWGKAPALSDFYRYSFYENRCLVKKKIKDQTRFRLLCDRDNLYCSLTFLGGDGAKADAATLYLAPGLDDKPVKVTFDRLSGKAAASPEIAGLEVKWTDDKAGLECRMPLKAVGLEPAKGFRANVVRTTQVGDAAPLVTYWRASQFSLESPVVYGQFVQGR